MAPTYESVSAARMAIMGGSSRPPAISHPQNESRSEISLLETDCHENPRKSEERDNDGTQNRASSLYTGEWITEEEDDEQMLPISRSKYSIMSPYKSVAQSHDELMEDRRSAVFLPSSNPSLRLWPPPSTNFAEEGNAWDTPGFEFSQHAQSAELVEENSDGEETVRVCTSDEIPSSPPPMSWKQPKNPFSTPTTSASSTFPSSATRVFRGQQDITSMNSYDFVLYQAGIPWSPTTSNRSLGVTTQAADSDYDANTLNHSCSTINVPILHPHGRKEGKRGQGNSRVNETMSRQLSNMTSTSSTSGARELTEAERETRRQVSETLRSTRQDNVQFEDNDIPGLESSTFPSPPHQTHSRFSSSNAGSALMNPLPSSPLAREYNPNNHDTIRTQQRTTMQSPYVIRIPGENGNPTGLESGILPDHPDDVACRNGNRVGSQIGLRPLHLPRRAGVDSAHPNHPHPGNLVQLPTQTQSRFRTQDIDMLTPNTFNDSYFPLPPRMQRTERQLEAESTTRQRWNKTIKWRIVPGFLILLSIVLSIVITGVVMHNIQKKKR